jgi:hypothetical protein
MGQVHTPSTPHRMAPKKKVRDTGKSAAGARGSVKQRRNKGTVDEELKDSSVIEQGVVQISSSHVKRASVSVESIASSPITSLASQYWAVSHAVSIYFNCFSFLLNVTNAEIEWLIGNGPRWL